MATLVAEISRFRTAIVANDHIQQYDPGFFAFHPVGHTLKRLAAMVAGQHDHGGRAISMPFLLYGGYFPETLKYYGNIAQSMQFTETLRSTVGTST